MKEYKRVSVICEEMGISKVTISKYIKKGLFFKYGASELGSKGPKKIMLISRKDLIEYNENLIK